MPNDYDARYWRQLILTIILLMIGSYTIAQSLYYVNALPHRAPLTDLLFDLIPFQQIYPALADLMLVLADAGFIIYVIHRKEYKRIPFFLFCIAMLQYVRAIIIPLTPLPTPFFDPKHFGLLDNFLIGGGTFPSGHVAQIFLLFLVMDKKYKNWRIYILILTILESFFMIASRGHYTIDVIGGLLITYCMYLVIDKYWNKKNLEKKSIKTAI